MALWQYPIYLVPKNELLKIVDHDVREISEEQFNGITGWRSYQWLPEARELLGQYLCHKKSWSDSIEQWGNEEEHCVEFIFEDAVLVHILVRLDTGG